ncbi:MAG: DUF2007 domain-containing protein [Bacteroidia bacterium]|jgi:hypothetical protein|nr:DUF2007 domain-containing protein [Bacteroidia bacterium]GIV22642.1 MAG: hypothetical protein KatS3mg025_0301 [Bacteroidia bacterium]
MKGWTPLTEAPNALWATVLRDYLSAAGIPAWIENEHIQQVLGSGLTGAPNPAFGPPRLWVPEALAEQARQLIEDFFSL